MIFDSRTYSVLIVSASERFAASLAPLLPVSRFTPVRHVSSIAAAKRQVAERSYDLILINTPLSDDFGTRFAVEMSDGSQSAVMLIVKAEIYEEVHYKVLDHGVYTLQKPASSQTVSLALGWLCAGRERIRNMEKKASTLDQRMAEIRLINRAKWILIEHEQLSEPEAHRAIEKRAMDKSISKVAVARAIIEAHSSSPENRP